MEADGWMGRHETALRAGGRPADTAGNVKPHPLELTREQVLAYRRNVQALDRRLPAGPESLHRAAWAGLTDSGPRAGLLSIHARVAGTEPSTWEDPSLVQVWGPRFSAYVIARPDIPIFTLGRLPDGGLPLQRAETTAARLRDFLDGRTMTYGQAGHAMGVSPNSLRYAAPTGTVLIRWEGARQPTIWTIPAPTMTASEARLELARRYLHAFGVGTSSSYAQWAGIKPRRARAAFDALETSLIPARTPIGEGWILAADEPDFHASPSAPAEARLLPSGDTYFLLQGADRALLVPDAARRAELWTPRVWPGAVLAGGDIVGVWRRAGAEVTVQAWRSLRSPERAAIEAEASGLPLPDLRTSIRVRWEP